MNEARQHGTAQRTMAHQRLAAIHALSAEQFVRECQLRGDELVLEVGCGGGHATRALQSALSDGGRVVALDAGALGLTRAKRLATGSPDAAPMEFRPYDRRTLPIDARERGTFDVVIVRHELQHTPDPSAVLATCLAATKADGRLLMVDDDLSTLRLTPPVDGFDAAWSNYTDHIQTKGIEPCFGRRLPAMVASLGSLRITGIAPMVYGGRIGGTRFELATNAVIGGLRTLHSRTATTPNPDDLFTALAAWRVRSDASLWYSSWFVEARRRIGAFFAITP